MPNSSRLRSATPMSRLAKQPSWAPGNTSSNAPTGRCTSPRRMVGTASSSGANPSRHRAFNPERRVGCAPLARPCARTHSPNLGGHVRIDHGCAFSDDRRARQASLASPHRFRRANRLGRSSPRQGRPVRCKHSPERGERGRVHHHSVEI